MDAREHAKTVAFRRLLLGALSPVGLMVIGFALWALMWASSPIEYGFDVRGRWLLVLAGYVAAFVAGCSLVGLLAAQRGPRLVVPILPPRSVELGMRVLCFIAAAGLALRYYDLLVLKSYAQFSSSTDYRFTSSLEGTVMEGRGPVSVISSGLYFVPLAAAVATIFLRPYLSRLVLWTARLMLLPFGLYVVLIGARGLLVTALVVLALSIALSALPTPGWRPRWDRRAAYALLAAVAVSGAFFAYSAMILKQRIEWLGMDTPQALNLFEDSRDVRFKDGARAAIERDDLAGRLVQNYAMLSYYLVHGFYHLNDLMDVDRGERPAGGTLQFAHVSRLVINAGLASEPASDPQERFPYPGVFYTFFGPVYVDFGEVGGMAFCLLFGIAAQSLYEKALRGSLAGAMVYPFFGHVALHMAVVNMLASGGGNFVLLALGLGWAAIAGTHGLAVELRRLRTRPLAGGLKEGHA